MRLNLPLLMITLVVITLLGAVFSFTLPSIKEVPTAIILHLIFAVGVIPLILGAMTYFVPVLTRTGAPSPHNLIPPLLAFVAGLLLIFSLWQQFQLMLAAAAIDLIAVLWLSHWIQQRRNSCLGTPHPGLLWYQIALLFLSVALLSIIAGYLWPEQWLAFRRLHLHLNLLGFIGLTALSTLRVLLPTVTHIADPNSALWLKNQWHWVSLGIVVIAVGSAWSTPVAISGAVIIAFPLLSLTRSLLIHQWRGIFNLHGAAPALATALTGFLLCLLISGSHIHGQLTGTELTLLFVLLFLLPLVTGAANHLIPLWVMSLPNSRSKEQATLMLGRFSAIRCALFVGSGLLLLAQIDLFYLPTLIALIHFLFLIISLYQNRMTQPIT